MGSRSFLGLGSASPRALCAGWRAAVPAEAHGGCTRASGSSFAAIGLELDLRREVSVVGAGLVGWAESEGETEKVGKPKPPQIPCSEAPQVRSSPREQAWPQWDLFLGLKTRGVPGDLLGCAGRSPAASRFVQGQKTKSGPCPAGFVRRWV